MFFIKYLKCYQFYMRKLFINLPKTSYQYIAQIAENTKYYPYFEDYLDALDGTYLALYIYQQYIIYRFGIEKNLSLKICQITICAFDQKFWKESGLDDCDFKRQNISKFLLVNISLSTKVIIIPNYLLCPYRGIQYHLKEQIASNLKFIIK